MPKEKYVKPSERKGTDHAKPPTKKGKTYKSKPQPSLSTLVNKHLVDYGHLFLGTNDFEVDLLKLQTQIQSEPRFQSLESAALVSNGWMFILFSLFKASPSLSHIFFYDTNPIMLFIYHTVLQLIKLSSSIDEFISFVFARHLHAKITSNASSMTFLQQAYSPDLYNSIKKKLKESSGDNGLAAEIYESLFFPYAIESKEKR